MTRGSDADQIVAIRSDDPESQWGQFMKPSSRQEELDARAFRLQTFLTASSSTSGDDLLIASGRARSARRAIRAREKAASKLIRQILVPFKEASDKKARPKSPLGSAPRPLTDISPPPDSSSSPLPVVRDTGDHGRLHDNSAKPVTLTSPQSAVKLLLGDGGQGAANDTDHATALSTRDEDEHPMFASVHQVLAKDPSYAEDVVFALNNLKGAQRDILFDQNRVSFEDVASTTSSSTPTPETGYRPSLGTSIVVPTSSCSPGQVPRAQPPQAKGRGKYTQQHRVQKRSGGQSEKKGKLPDDGGGGDNDSDGDGGSGSGSPGGYPPESGPRKHDNRWACPYCLVFGHHMLDNVKFKSCRPPGSLTNRSLWKDHLKKYHSPDARGSTPLAAHAMFYMDQVQWAAVEVRIAADISRRPRAYDSWFKVQKDCFLDVWRIIFPITQFPNLTEPISPFHPDSNTLENLGAQGRLLLETLRGVRAARAVSSGTVPTVQQFRPSDQEYMEMMAEAVAILANMSPGTCQWLANVSGEGVQAAVAGRSQVTAASGAGNPHADYVFPSQTTPESSSGSSPSDHQTDSVPAVMPTAVALYPGGTHIHLEVSPNDATQPGQRMAYLQVIPPLGYSVDSYRRTEILPVNPAACAGMAVSNPAPASPLPLESADLVGWDPNNWESNWDSAFPSTAE